MNVRSAPERMPAVPGPIGWRCRLSGLNVLSELAMPETTRSPGGVPDVHVQLRPPRHEGIAHHELTVSGDLCRLRAPEAGTYEITGGRQITVTPLPDADEALLRLFLLGSAWGALLHQRGTLALHAAVVQVDGGAVAFCGLPGAGKSSVAAWLCRRGHALLSDDLCRLDVPAQGPPSVWRSLPRLKLSVDALRMIGRASHGLEPVVPTDKFHLPCPEAPTVEHLPLVGIGLLGWGPAALRRLRGTQALKRFVAASTYRPRLLSSNRDQATHWLRCADVVRRVPVWELQRPRDWSSLDELPAQLIEIAAPS